MAPLRIAGGPGCPVNPTAVLCPPRPDPTERLPMPADDTTNAWLRDLEALRRLGQEYARAVDGRDHDAVAALFDPDGVVDGVRGSSPVPAYLEGMRSAPQAFTASQHVLGEPLIDLEPGADTARLDTYAVVYQMGRVDDPDVDMVLGMRYVDEVVRRDGRWLIHPRVASALWVRPR
jgi:hypothetical protein